MSLFIETIKIENGQLQHLALHLQRIQNTCVEYYGTKKNLDELRGHFKRSVQDKQGRTKLTITYDPETHFFCSNPYFPKKIDTLYMVENNELDYHLKYADRSIFDEYSRKVGFKNEAVIIRNNRFTDATYANLAFWNGKEWHTPLHPLLKGIKRNYLLQNKHIVEHDILVTDLIHYQKVALINAMLELGELEIATDRIIYFSDI